MYKRLTTEKPEGIFDGICNATKIIDREIYLREFNNGKDMSLVDYCKNRHKEIFEEEMDLDVPAEEFGEYMDYDCIICDYYHLATGYAELRERLKKYEDSGLSPEQVIGFLEVRKCDKW